MLKDDFQEEEKLRAELDQCHVTAPEQNKSSGKNKQHGSDSFIL